MRTRIGQQLAYFLCIGVLGAVLLKLCFDVHQLQTQRRVPIKGAVEEEEGEGEGERSVRGGGQAAAAAAAEGV
uniref:Uncharacterized protein n=1 Tax=Chromera velia CCMP2878 TaxID=1169474 RepID=A0A0G4HBK3_9ALVE|eukprot:Cvel_6150.t1-p1 / transcript=Cvel_6150.t1 / gene=Cvel_6150 / organism=Chromera_velia_CCMP2878 / gene_product=hypothetical protein / transcript_product=hypothetical protein / location=Cvel_scaffold297:74764-74979(+) / protein_length=72 / sequence_SO=supercontig / SO=protein_coding / is_pseudo=false